MSKPTLLRMCPYFIVSSVPESLTFYCRELGFQTLHSAPDDNPFFAIVVRDGAMLFLKSGTAEPVPNSVRDQNMRWDAYVSVDHPDGLAGEFNDRGVRFSSPLQDTHDGLRGFEVTDPNGYVLFFGRPRRDNA